ncbi:MAG TPA: hypothetical protein VFC73_00405 [Syntrophomonadaceae bacterium]|nr:hypothetical protein [Syntrophomonadaceae bacterium]
MAFSYKTIFRRCNMKGYIAFCPHFHQPHFQLYKTREEAFQNSYLPWLELLTSAVNIEGFYINLHLSGPLLYWLRDQKQDYVKEFKSLVSTNKIGLIGGLADEPFVQLSSRSDDYLYQLKKYNEILHELTGVKAEEWEGIHIVERECGELVLKELSYAAKLMNSPPIFYLDAETFYESHFNYPGSDYDYCLKHFGFEDPVAKTTIGHIPQKLLHYAFRDELAGQEFFSVPVHSQYRYQLLKRQSFTVEDKVKIKPSHYYFYIKDALEEAARLSKIYGRDIDPILVMFEDAEKLGQWSKDPQGDVEWLLEFFELVAADDELEFIGLKQYIDKCGYLDTYPVSLSHSYPEWENWTAKRGIRGVTFGDERLRRVICRLRDFEDEQEVFENLIIGNLNEKLSNIDIDVQQIINRSILNSPERFELITKLLQDDPEKLMIYEMINRIRNLVYQEDPKWASRHPSYGSSPFYDVTGLAYLEIAYKVLQSLTKENNQEPNVIQTDWDYDGQDEVLIENIYQTVVIDAKGGCISYQNVIAPQVATSLEKMTTILADDSHLPAYNSIYRFAYPIIFTEADSTMAIKFYDEGGRKEVSRNSFRCHVLVKENGEYYPVGDFHTAQFSIQSVEKLTDGAKVVLSSSEEVNLNGGQALNITLTKTFLIEGQSITCNFELEGNMPTNIKLALSPEIVSSAAASDEVNFRPKSFLGIEGDGNEIQIDIKDISVVETEGISYKSEKTTTNLPDKIDYIFEIKSADGKQFWNSISYSLVTNNEIETLQIRPAIMEYYKDYVFESQSILGYHTSGLLINPIIVSENNNLTFGVTTNWKLETNKTKEDYQQIFNLID